jgi:hypothetical protein
VSTVGRHIAEKTPKHLLCKSRPSAAFSIPLKEFDVNML